MNIINTTPKPLYAAIPKSPRLAGMSKKGKKREEDEALSEGDEPPKKSSRTENNSDDSDQIVVCELSKNRRVSVRNWQGKIVVDIREFYIKDGKEFPGKKGISLSMDQWKILKDHVDEIDQEVAGNN
ncbi:RNA polymerase II transcriptional coactivator KIWI [Striga hermonthica]|uniref:RNA polymerase II transcriptional coactivator KIWI n=1 Tax=Striga hermonthica TaxID=68872 RepID=A0A9N7RAC4_STRHE|nr:RNA polymerase II transcriptional coactivator KIWI [Striga hermonthica]